MKAGYPVLPVKYLEVKVDGVVNRVEVSVEVLEMDLGTGYEILPCPQPRILQPRNRTALEIRPNMEVYGSFKPYPESWFSYTVRHGTDPLSLAEISYIGIKIYPLRYIPREGRLILGERITVTVRYWVSRTGRRLASKVSIVTSGILLPAAERLKSVKESEGWTVNLTTVDDIVAEYPGADTQEKIRNFIADKYSEGYSYVIIFGDADQVPARLAYIPDGYDDNDNPNYSGDGSYVETDLYYADLDGTWDDNGDGKYGDIDHDMVDGVPDVMVGRLPASTLTEAYTLVNKIGNYTPQNSWLKKYLFLGTVTFGDPLTPEGEIIKDTLEYEYLPSDFYWYKLYEQEGTLTPAAVIGQINQGYGFVNFGGHGSPTGWWFGPSGGSLTITDVDSLANGYIMPVVLTMACSTSRYYDYDCIGERFLLNPNGGAIAYFGSSRVAWGYGGQYVIYGLAGKIDLLFSKVYFNLSSQGTSYLGAVWSQAETTYIVENGIGNIHDWKTVAEYGTMLGDPTVAPMGTGLGPTPNSPPWLNGTVRDLITGPISRATVRIYNYYNQSLIAETTTDQNGRFSFQDLPPLTVVLQASNGSYTSNVTFYYDRVNVTMEVIIYTGLPPDTVLVVVDDDSPYAVDEGVWPGEFRQPIESMGYNIVLFNESISGRPTSQLLRDAVAVIWHTGTHWGSGVIDVDEAQLLLDYIQDGGRLFLEGEDIGYEHDNDEFMNEVAHAHYSVDNAGSNTLEVTLPDHPITQGLPLNFSFESTPPAPDGVLPANGGFEVVRYQSLYSAIVAWSGPNGAKTVYASFPLHYLYQAERNTLIQNVVRWLLSNYTVAVDTRPRISAPGADVRVEMKVLNGSTPITGLSPSASIYYPNGSLLSILTLYDDGLNGGDQTVGDGIYTGNITMPASAPDGLYEVKASAYITSHGVEVSSTTIEVISGYNLILVAYNITDMPAANAAFNIYRVDSGTYIAMWHYFQANGTQAYNLPAGNYSIMIWTSWRYHYSGGSDNFAFWFENVSVGFKPVVVEVRPWEGRRIDVECYELDATPMTYYTLDAHVKPEIGLWALNLVWSSGSHTAQIYTTDDNFRLSLIRGGTPSYYLYQEVSAGQNSVTFNPTPSTTSNLTLKKHRSTWASCYIQPAGLNTTWWYGFDGMVVVTPDLWRHGFSYVEIYLDNGYWDYWFDVWPHREFNVSTPGSNTVIDYAGNITLEVRAMGRYWQGGDVPIWWDPYTNYGERLTDIYESTNPIRRPLAVTMLDSSMLVAYSGGAGELDHGGRVSMEHYPYLTIIGPDGSPVVCGQIYWYENPKHYSLSPSAPDGAYIASITIETGPYQGSISDLDYFFVGCVDNGSISGYVLISGSDSPVGNASITVVGPSYNPSSRSVQANSLGYYYIGDLEPGYYTVTAFSDGYQNSTLTVLVMPGQNLSLNITLEPADIAVSIPGGFTAFLNGTPSSTFTAGDMILIWVNVSNSGVELDAYVWVEVQDPYGTPIAVMFQIVSLTPGEEATLAFSLTLPSGLSPGVYTVYCYVSDCLISSGGHFYTSYSFQFQVV